MVNKEACPYLSISLIQQTFKLFVCSNFFTCFLEEQMSLNTTVIAATWRRKSLGQQVLVLESMKEHKIGSGGLMSLQLWMQLMQNSEVASTGSMLLSFQQYIFLQNWWDFILIHKQRGFFVAFNFNRYLIETAVPFGFYLHECFRFYNSACVHLNCMGLFSHTWLIFLAPV